ncbi:hypothetical protein FS837_002172, partial [Tulasnella sp. UAMH 9824]
MAELSLAEKSLAALWHIESPAEQIRILRQNDKQFEPYTNFHPLRTDVLNLLFKMIIKAFGGGSEDASSRLDPALKALKIFATLVSSMEDPLRVYTVDVWSTKINFLIGSQIAESADKAGKRLPVRSWLLTIVEKVYNAIYTEYQSVSSRVSRLDHATILNLLYTALFHRTDQAHGDPDVRQAIFKNISNILSPYSASELSFPEVSSNAVKKYGPKRILERCTDLLNHGFVGGATTVIAQLSQVPVAHEPIFLTGRLHLRLVEKYWGWTKNPSEDPQG